MRKKNSPLFEFQCWLQEERDMIITLGIIIIALSSMIYFRDTLSKLPYKLLYEKHVIETIQKNNTIVTYADPVAKVKQIHFPHNKPMYVPKVNKPLDTNEIDNDTYLDINWSISNEFGKALKPFVTYIMQDGKVTKDEYGIFYHKRDSLRQIRQLGYKNGLIESIGR